MDAPISPQRGEMGLVQEGQNQMGHLQEVIGYLRIDPKIQSYKTFFDHEWARKIAEFAARTKFEEPVNLLFINWKSAANTHFMPWLMINCIKEFWSGYLRGQESLTEQIASALAEKLPASIETTLSATKRRKLVREIQKIGQKAKEKRENDTEEISASALWSEFLHSSGGSELQLSVWGSQRICYGAVYHAYEDFIRHCVGLARGEPDYRVFSAKALIKDVASAFGKDIAERCLSDQSVRIARLVRNALAHNGGKINEDLSEMPHDIEIENDVLQIMPDNNRRLFDTLKMRAIEFIEKAVTVSSER